MVNSHFFNVNASPILAGPPSTQGVANPNQMKSWWFNVTVNDGDSSVHIYVGIKVLVTIEFYYPSATVPIFNNCSIDDNNALSASDTVFDDGIVSGRVRQYLLLLQLLAVRHVGWKG